MGVHRQTETEELDEKEGSILLNMISQLVSCLLEVRRSSRRMPASKQACKQRCDDDTRERR